jgi:hypothetical protein
VVVPCPLYWGSSLPLWRSFKAPAVSSYSFFFWFQKEKNARTSVRYHSCSCVLTNNYHFGRASLWCCLHHNRSDKRNSFAWTSILRSKELRCKNIIISCVVVFVYCTFISPARFRLPNSLAKTLVFLLSQSPP